MSENTSKSRPPESILKDIEKMLLSTGNKMKRAAPESQQKILADIFSAFSAETVHRHNNQKPTALGDLIQHLKSIIDATLPQIQKTVKNPYFRDKAPSKFNRILSTVEEYVKTVSTVQSQVSGLIGEALALKWSDLGLLKSSLIENFRNVILADLCPEILKQLTTEFSDARNIAKPISTQQFDTAFDQYNDAVNMIFDDLEKLINEMTEDYFLKVNISELYTKVLDTIKSGADRFFDASQKKEFDDFADLIKSEFDNFNLAIFDNYSKDAEGSREVKNYDSKEYVLGKISPNRGSLMAGEKQFLPMIEGEAFRILELHTDNNRTYDLVEITNIINQEFHAGFPIRKIEEIALEVDIEMVTTDLQVAEPVSLSAPVAAPADEVKVTPDNQPETVTKLPEPHAVLPPTPTITTVDRVKMDEALRQHQMKVLKDLKKDFDDICEETSRQIDKADEALSHSTAAKALQTLQSVESSLKSEVNELKNSSGFAAPSDWEDYLVKTHRQVSSFLEFTNYVRGYAEGLELEDANSAETRNYGVLRYLAALTLVGGDSKAMNDERAIYDDLSVTLKSKSNQVLKLKNALTNGVQNSESLISELWGVIQSALSTLFNSGNLSDELINKLSEVDVEVETLRKDLIELQKAASKTKELAISISNGLGTEPVESLLSKFRLVREAQELLEENTLKPYALTMLTCKGTFQSIDAEALSRAEGVNQCYEILQPILGKIFADTNFFNQPNTTRTAEVVDSYRKVSGSISELENMMNSIETDLQSEDACLKVLASVRKLLNLK